MSRRTPRPLALGATLVLAGGILLAGSVPAGAAAKPSVVALSGSAYGSTAAVGPISSGRTAFFSACATTPGGTYGSNVEATDLGPGLGTVGAVVTSGSRTKDTMVVTSTTAPTSLLGGLVQADAIKATATAKYSGGHRRTSGSTVVTGLKVDGATVKVSSKEDSHITIPGVARLTFNHQSTSKNDVTRKITVQAVRVDLLKGNKLGLTKGSIVIGSATAGASKPTSFVASGTAYGTSVDVGGTVVSGPTAKVGLACGGSGGDTVKNKVAGVSLPGLVTSTSVESTAQSKESTGKTKAVFTDETERVSLLDGVVTAGAVKAKATTTRSKSGITTSDEGTKISDLKVLGLPVKVSSKANSTIDVAGVGTLTLHKTVPVANGLDVVGLELRLGSDRGGVKAGTVVQVAVAKARVAAS